MKKDKQVATRWPMSEYNKIVIGADNKGMTVSEYIRYMVDIGEKADYKETHAQGKNNRSFLGGVEW